MGKPQTRKERIRAAQRLAEEGGLPDFLVIGTQKGGTSLFYRFLVDHPLILPSVTKELHYFDWNYEEGPEWYRRCFPQQTYNDGRRTLTGEASPSYLFDRRVPERMAATVPDAKLIALLRNPVDRAYSQYQMHSRFGTENRGFEEAVEAEMSGETGPPNYLARGIYAEQLARFSPYAEGGRLLVLKSEDFFARPRGEAGRAFAFLGLPSFQLEEKRNRSGGGYPPMDVTTRRRLDEYFGPHNERLYDMLGRDMGW